MSDRVALITGGGRGIGRGIALELGAHGWAVAMTYRTSEQAAQETVTAVAQSGGNARAFRCDVSDAAAGSALVAQVERSWGRIDALIHCAGPYHRINLMEETPEGWASMFDNNLHPVFSLTQAAAPGMKARQYGRIITFSMANADQMIAQPDVTAHYIAKAGILILTRTWAKMLAPFGITANAVSPGFIDSGSAPAEELAGIVKRIPVGYVGEVRDPVAAVRFLLSDDARYVTGTNIHVSGGWGV
jgi:3-oxoacyl-[acyl-carrier protein] reductase